MKNKLFKIFFTFIFTFIFMLGTKVTSNAAVSASSKTVNSGENVSISITSNPGVASYAVTVTDLGGLTFVTSSGGTGAGTKTITDTKTTNMTALATYTFKAPNVTSDTTYKVSFKASAMETADLDPVADSTFEATITVKAPQTPSNENNSNSNSSTTGTDTNTGSNSNSSSSETNTNSSSSGSNSTSSSNSGSASTSTATQTKSSNANLSNLITSPVDFTGFKSSKTSGYSITVDNNVTEVKVTAKVQDSKASYKVTGNTNLKAGQTNVVKVTVTAEDGTQKVYKVNVIRKNSEEENVPNVIETPEEKQITKTVNLTLKSLEIKGVELDPEFKSNVYEYNADLTEDLTELEVIAVATQPDDTTIEVTGNKELKDGENIITIVVKSLDKNESKTYTVKVNKKTDELIEESVLSTGNNNGNNIGITLSKVDFSDYSKTQKIITLIIIGCTIYLVGIDIYILIQERKFASKKQKYVGKRVKI